MTYVVRAFKLALCLTALSAAPAFSQTASDDAAPVTAPAPPVAYVYAQTTKGVNLYDAAPNGKLNLVKGSPFKTSGEMIGSTGKYFVTLGTYWVHAYAIKSNGAIGKEVSAIDTEDYEGSACEHGGDPYGPPGAHGGFLDHSRQNLYVMLGNVESGSCVAYQTFGIENSSGALKFKGALLHSTKSGWGVVGMPTLTANDKFAYDDMGQYGLADDGAPLTGFKRTSAGVLQLSTFKEKDPEPLPGFDWLFYVVAADPTNHLAVHLIGHDRYPRPQQLASYTVDGKGNIASTNTYEDMPVPAVTPSVMSISPSGKILAIGGYSGDCYDAPGLQVFHFNGAMPITPFGQAFGNGCFEDFNAIQWDKSNHLYAYSFLNQLLFVYTVTPTSIAQAPGSPYTLVGTGANSLVVVPK